MAHFYGTLRGSRGTEVSKTGTKKTGIKGRIAGWDVGVEVVCEHKDGEDICKIYKLKGSKDPSGDFLGKISEDDLEFKSKQVLNNEVV